MHVVACFSEMPKTQYMLVMATITMVTHCEWNSRVVIRTVVATVVIEVVVVVEDTEVDEIMAVAATEGDIAVLVAVVDHRHGALSTGVSFPVRLSF